MHLDPEICYRALRTRDARFDGRFFTAVRTTGIYCRPTCPARTPRRENCWFVPCAAAAEAAGFRPCRRCRPESAPGTPAWLGTSATVSRGLRLIAEGALDTGGVGDLAARLGLGERQLRRLFAVHLGAGPIAVARTRRAHFAAELLTQTDWPISRVALAAGYTSLRRFNEAIRATFHRSPRELRAKRRPDSGSSPAIRLPYRGPYDAEGLFAYLAARAVPGVEWIRGTRVRRALRIAGHPVVVDVRASATAWEIRASSAGAAHWLALAERARSVFDLAADPGEIGRQLAADPGLRPLLRRRPGVRVPGAWDPFEIAVRIVLGQQVTVAGATQLAGRLAMRFGERLPDELLDRENGPTLLFPQPDALAEAPLEEIGLTRQRASALRALAAAVACGELTLAPGADPEAARATLVALPGIGPWTAELVLMRALGEPDAFPAGDLGLQRAARCGARALELRAERWRPWRAYAAMLLWTASRTIASAPARPVSRAVSARVLASSPRRAARGRT